MALVVLSKGCPPCNFTSEGTWSTSSSSSGLACVRTSSQSFGADPFLLSCGHPCLQSIHSTFHQVSYPLLTRSSYQTVDSISYYQDQSAGQVSNQGTCIRPTLKRRQPSCSVLPLHESYTLPLPNLCSEYPVWHISSHILTLYQFISEILKLRFL